MLSATEYLSRTEVQAYGCPRCNAKPGESCRGVRRLREANHLERVKRARRMEVLRSP